MKDIDFFKTITAHERVTADNEKRKVFKDPGCERNS